MSSPAFTGVIPHLAPSHLRFVINRGDQGEIYWTDVKCCHSPTHFLGLTPVAPKGAEGEGFQVQPNDDITLFWRSYDAHVKTKLSSASFGVDVPAHLLVDNEEYRLPLVQFFQFQHKNSGFIARLSSFQGQVSLVKVARGGLMIRSIFLPCVHGNECVHGSDGLLNTLKNRREHFRLNKYELFDFFPGDENGELMIPAFLQRTHAELKHKLTKVENLEKRLASGGEDNEDNKDAKGTEGTEGNSRKKMKIEEEEV